MAKEAVLISPRDLKIIAGSCFVIGFAVRDIIATRYLKHMKEYHPHDGVSFDLATIKRKAREQGWVEAKAFYLATGDIMPHMPME